MEIHHKVKPLHGWREFVGEVGIIVLGVLIALGAEQVVEAIHWRHQAEMGEEALAGDFASIVWVAREREWSSYCMSRRFEAVAQVLDVAAKTNRLPSVDLRIGGPTRQWSAPSWNSLVASGTAHHLPRKKLLMFGAIARYAEFIDANNIEEKKFWATLNTIVGPGRRISDEEVGHLIEALRNAVDRAANMRLSAHQIQAEIRASGLPIAEAYAEGVRENGKPDHGRARNDCKMRDGPSELYGYSPSQRAALEQPLVDQ